MSSGMSFDSVSDYLRSRTSDGSTTRSLNADRFLAESLDDETRGDPISPFSSTADSRAAAAELRRRDSSSQRDAVGMSSMRTEFVIPRLEDEEVGEVKPDELGLYDEPELMPFGVAGPAPFVPDYFGPTLTTSITMRDTLLAVGASSLIEARVPDTFERPWTAPEGYICVYEKFFTECGLFFPLPKFLLEYASNRKMAFSQLSVAAIRNGIGLLRLGLRCGVKVTCAHYEETTQFKSFGKKKPGLFYVQSSGTPKLVEEAKSKTNAWSAHYFFVKISRDSVEDPRLPNYTEWKLSPEHYPKFLNPYPEQLHADIVKIRAVGPYVWPVTKKVSRRRPRRSNQPRRAPARRTRPSQLAMGKVDLTVIPDLSKKFDKRPAREPEKPSNSEEQQIEEARRRSLLDRGGRHAHAAGSSRPLSPRSEKEKKREAAAARLAAQATETLQVPPPALVGSQAAAPMTTGPGTLVVPSDLTPVGRKRAASAGEDRSTPGAKRSRVADHRWSYRYVERDVPFASNALACAELFREVGYGPGTFPLIEDLKEREAYIEAARHSCEATSAMNRLVYSYERRLRRLPADHSYSGDYEAALAVEREKSERVAQELVTAKDQIGRLQREVAKVTHHRTGLTEDRDRLIAEVESVKGQYNDLVSYVRAEKKRLRERREEYGHYLRSRGLAKLARLVDTRLTRIRAHVDDTSAVQPKLLEYNQALGNVRLLRALEESGEIVIKSPSVMSQLVTAVAELETCVRAFNITDLMDGDFDVRTLFDVPPVTPPSFQASDPSEQEGDGDRGDDQTVDQPAGVASTLQAGVVQDQGVEVAAVQEGQQEEEVDIVG
ncbi:hypothetical protein ISN44_As11g023450 [Arabidopsis suecica]|uniref:DUF1204 domain-containing protein n=1 Tax=Arabidopsis suecica TaxID=45249 RepID=A0A8T1ZBU2_ARASU|nr:hypothetical protein ISN44_As11g023450 [Arabidopsis suecica]